MNTIVAVDPGKLSGYVKAQINYSTGELKIIEYLELDQQSVCLKVEKDIEDEDVSEIVCEDFIITVETAKKKETRYSLEIIGLIRFLCNKHGVYFTLQTPQRAKTFSDDQRLKDLDLYIKGGQGHHRDAMRHLVLYLVLHDWRPPGLV